MLKGGKIAKKILKWTMLALASVVGLFLLLATLIYLPPVQRWAKDCATNYLSEETNLKVSIERVRLSFPLDLLIDDFWARNDSVTVARAQELLLDIKLLPLFSGKVELNGFELRNAELNSEDLISNVQIEGRFKLLSIDKPTVCDLLSQEVEVNKVRMRDSRFRVLLSDTAAVDTTQQEPLLWKIGLKRAEISNSDFYVQMPGDSMRVSGFLQNFSLRDANFDLGKELYKITSLKVCGSNIACDAPRMPAQKGFDSNHLLFEALEARFSDFAFSPKGLEVDLSHLALREKCGLRIEDATAKVHYDSTRVDLSKGRVVLPNSELKMEAHLPFSALQSKGAEDMEVRLKGSLALQDLKTLLPPEISSELRALDAQKAEVALRAEGTMSSLLIDYCHLNLPHKMSLRLSGQAYDVASESRRNGRLHYTLELEDMSFALDFLPKDLRKDIRIPKNLYLSGNVNFLANRFELQKNALHSGKGYLSFDGSFDAKSLSYQAHLVSHQFPFASFLPTLEMAPLSAEFEVKGRGLDFLKQGTSCVAHAQIHGGSFMNIPLEGIEIDANLDGPCSEAKINANNSWLKGNLALEIQQTGDELSALLNGSLKDLALSLGRTDSVSKKIDTHLIAKFHAKARINNKAQRMMIGGEINPLNAYSSRIGYPGGNIRFGLGTSPDSTHIYLNSGDMVMKAKSREPLMQIIESLSRVGQEFATKFTTEGVNQDSLKQLLPQIDLSLIAQHRNPIYQIAKLNGYSFDSLDINLHTSKTQGLNGRCRLSNLKIDAMLFEQSEIDIHQQADAIKLSASISNTNRKNPNRFKAHIDGALQNHGFEVLANFLDKDNREGLNIGARTQFEPDGAIRLTLIPEVSTIAYRKFKVNKDNYLRLDTLNLLSADIDLQADDKTNLKLFSAPSDSAKQDITLSIGHLNLSDLSSVIPYMPQMGGYLDGDIHLIKEHQRLTAVGALEGQNLIYEGTKLGSLATELFYMPQENDHYVVAHILKDDQEIAILEGTYSDNDKKELQATLTLDRLPCNILNPFLGDDGTLALKGNLDGEININGPADKLLFNGLLSPDSIHAFSELYGFDLRMENKPLQIIDSKIKFDRVAFYSTSPNPLIIRGDVNFSDIENILADLRIEANNFELINSAKTKKSMVYGKVFVDMDMALKGKADLMLLRGQIKVLKNTNVTYVLTDTPLQVDDQFAGLVEFEDFLDDQQDKSSPEQAMSGVFINLNLSVNEEARLHCELSPDGKSYLDCRGGGDIGLRIFPSGEMSVDGRFNIHSGEMKYTLPFIPLKTFKFDEGCYILFTGDVMNPTLNITAKERVRATVTDENDLSRMVNFDVGVKITRQLSDMGIEFIIEAIDDQEVQNELATLSAETKNKLSITMLATGLYMSTSNKAGFRANNALNAFLESEIQNIAGNALKTIDISVGVEGNTTQSGDTQTDYTFQFSKKLWNDRVTFVIGGKVTSGATDNAASQSFIDNISIEYRLDSQNTRYLRMFYDNDTYDPLEGRYSSAGGGYIIRRKTNNLGELIIFRKQKPSETEKP